jgi:serine/threonine protein kinase
LIRKDIPRSDETPAAVPADSGDEELLTSEDLFGDLVDAPLAPAPAKAAGRSGPVKVRVAEKAGPEVKGPQAADVPPEEMASLIDAFGPGPSTAPPPEAPIASGGAEVDALLEKLSAHEAPAPRLEPAPPPPNEQPRAKEIPTPVEAGPPDHETEEDLGLLLDQLGDEEPQELPAAEPIPDAGSEPTEEPVAASLPEPLEEPVVAAMPEAPEEPVVAAKPEAFADDVAIATEPTEEGVERAEVSPSSPSPTPLAAADGEEVGRLLDVFSEHGEEPVPTAPPDGEQASLVDSLGPAEMQEAPTDEAPPPPELATPAESGATAEEDLDEVLARFLPTVSPPVDAGPPVTALKFQAAEPSVEAPKETRTVIDLAALADEALSLPLTRPGVPLGANEPAPQPSAVSPPDSYGPYRLLERIAAGGMAEVFRAKRSGVEGFEKVVAVKRILPHLSDNKEFVDMFIDEAKMVAGLSHPNIVQIFDLGRIERTYFIAMEYVHGRDLRTILKRAKEKGLRIPLDLSVLIISKVCSALEYAHRKKDENGQPLRIVHRDISPQNILISFEGEVKLTDFGIAKATSKATDTDRGALRGKLLYMSPEQASGHALDRRSDVFSLGVVFYEMITDVKPFLGTSEKGILQLVRECRFEPARSLNPKISEKLEGVVTRALVKDPDERYQDASEMYRDLERVLHERQPPAATELARFMEILFEGGEAPAAPQIEVPEPQNEVDIEIDLDSGEPQLAESPEGGEPPKDPQGIGKLLKRLGIKQR